MTLSTYAQDFLGNLYSYLDYSGSTLSFIVDETLEAMDLTSETEITASNTKAAHAILRVKALEQCLNDLSIDFKISADGSSYDRQQVFDMVQKRLETAYADAESYLPETKIVVGEVDYTENPYDIKTYVNWW